MQRTLFYRCRNLKTQNYCGNTQHFHYTIADVFADSCSAIIESEAGLNEKRAQGSKGQETIGSIVSLGLC